MRFRRFGFVVAGAAVVAAGGTASGSASEGQTAQACTPKNNIEAILDDSGSMSLNDSTKKRAQAVKLVMATPGNEQKTLGAVEFGSDANPVFGPGVIGAGNNRNDFGLALDNMVNADNGGTDYNAGFSAAASHNPNADMRIFLTDGEHNAGAYAEGHKGGPPTSVVGLFQTISADDEARLRQIASDTGGLYRRVTDDSELQPAMADVNAFINCQARPVRFTDIFRRPNQVKRRAITIPGGVRSVLFSLSWEEEDDRFDVAGFRVVRRGRTVAKAQVRRLRVRKRRGDTFVTARVSRLVRGRLRFVLRARRVSPSSTGGVKLITQASRSRR